MKKKKKRALVIRYGALGDGIIATACFPYLKRDGYDITLRGSGRVLDVCQNNPHISSFVKHERGSVEQGKLHEHFETIGEGYDKVVNLTSTMENKHLFCYPQPEYYKSLGWRRWRNAPFNWYENQVIKAGYEPEGRVLGQMFFSKKEVKKVKYFLKRLDYKKNFIFMWALSGSSIHKVYRWYEKVAREFLKRHPNSILISSGGYEGKILTFQHERAYDLSRTEQPFRFSACLSKYVNLVLGPETGLLNAAGCFKTPKICFLTHSGKHNLTRHWHNDYSMQSHCHCSPCYYLHKYKSIWQNWCEVDDLGWPKCVDTPGAGHLLDTMEEIYHKWRSSNGSKKKS